MRSATSSAKVYVWLLIVEPITPPSDDEQFTGWQDEVGPFDFKYDRGLVGNW